MSDEITYPYLNFTAIEVWEWISNFNLTLYRIFSYLSMLWLKLIYINKRGPWLTEHYSSNGMVHVIWDIFSLVQNQIW